MGNRAQSLEAVGDWILMTDNLDRVLLYSSSAGERKAKWFGYNPQTSPRRVALARQRRRASS